MQPPSLQSATCQDCFRLLAALLRDCAAYSPTTAQLRFLLRWAFEDLGEAGSQPTSFALLRALLGRRVVLPEVYDVMERVQQIMVRACVWGGGGIMNTSRSGCSRSWWARGSSGAWDIKVCFPRTDGVGSGLDGLGWVGA